jgi:hypothetical protein
MSPHAIGDHEKMSLALPLLAGSGGGRTNTVLIVRPPHPHMSNGRETNPKLIAGGLEFHDTS